MRSCAPAGGAEQPDRLAFGNLLALAHRRFLQMHVPRSNASAMFNDYIMTVELVEAGCADDPIRSRKYRIAGFARNIDAAVEARL